MHETTTARLPCGLVDSFGRRITYLRLSVTDRCDLRCVYCMPEAMKFMARRNLMTFSQLAELAELFVLRGVRKLRITGGEPLVRPGVMDLFRDLSRHLRSGALHELTLTTNGTMLSRYADELAIAGVRRINVSLDTLDAARFRKLTRGGELAKVLDGLAAAQAVGLKIKLNVVALKDGTEEEIHDLIDFAHSRAMSLSLIETMPLGEVGADRLDQYLPLNVLRKQIADRWTIHDVHMHSGGPARYVRIVETGGLVGFITPHTHNFCDTCNRVRVTATGMLHTCLGHEDGTDLSGMLRVGGQRDQLTAAIDDAISRKPHRHAFVMERGMAPSLSRRMSDTGG